MEQISIDEAYVDAPGAGCLVRPGPLVLKKHRTRKRTALSFSVGIAPKKFLAKLASDMDKSDGMTIITPGQALGFIDRLPIEKVPGIGGKMAKGRQI